MLVRIQPVLFKQFLNPVPFRHKPTTCLVIGKGICYDVDTIIVSLDYGMWLNATTDGKFYILIPSFNMPGKETLERVTPPFPAPFVFVERGCKLCDLLEMFTESLMVILL